jgi:hypothetical protein
MGAHFYHLGKRLGGLEVGRVLCVTVEARVVEVCRGLRGSEEQR